MEYKNPWKINSKGGKTENPCLFEYFSEKSGLCFSEFNTTQGLNGNYRSIDAIRFPNQRNGIYESKENYPEIIDLFKTEPVEIIEIHKWGFYALGQLLGKTAILQERYNPNIIQKVLITTRKTKYHPQLNPDPPTEKAIREFGIEVYVPTLKKLN